MAGTMINEATLRETLKGTENIPIVDTDLPKGRVTAEKLKEYVQPDKLKTAKTIDGKQFDGSKNISHLAVCSTNGGTATKAVTMSDFTIDTGSRLEILFEESNTAYNVSLSVNGSQAHPICYQGVQIGKGVLKAGCVYLLEYYQRKWHIVGEIVNVDAELSDSSTNPVQNNVIAEKVKGLADKVTVVDHGTNDTTFTLTPNVYHKWGEVATLTLTLGTPTDGVVNEYMAQFVSGTTATVLTLPETVKWMGDNTIEAGKTYQLSIIDNLAVLGGA